MAEKYQKASDVFANTDFVFGRKVSFAEAFPTIAEAKVEVEETDFGNPIRTHYRSTTTGMGEFVNCTNRSCYNGGVNIGEILHHMVHNKLTEYQAEYAEYQSCQGYEGSPKGRKKTRRCLHGFNVKASIKYKVESEQPVADQALAPTPADNAQN